MIFYPLTMPPVYNITARSSSSQATISSPLPSSELWSYTGVPPGLARVGVPGQKLDSMRILKTQGRSSGAVIVDKRTWLSTSFEVGSTSAICCDGLTGTRSQLRRRVRPQFLGPRGYGLLPISPLQSGSRFWMQQQLQHCFDDWS